MSQVDVTSYRKKVQQDALGKVNRVKEIRRRGKDGLTESTIDSEGFKGGTRGTPIMPRDTVSRTAHVGTVGTNG